MNKIIKINYIFAFLFGVLAPEKVLSEDVKESNNNIKEATDAEMRMAFELYKVIALIVNLKKNDNPEIEEYFNNKFSKQIKEYAELLKNSKQDDPVDGLLRIMNETFLFLDQKFDIGIKVIVESYSSEKNSEERIKYIRDLFLHLDLYIKKNFNIEDAISQDSNDSKEEKVGFLIQESYKFLDRFQALNSIIQQMINLISSGEVLSLGFKNRAKLLLGKVLKNNSKEEIAKKISIVVSKLKKETSFINEEILKLSRISLFSDEELENAINEFYISCTREIFIISYLEKSGYINFPEEKEINDFINSVLNNVNYRGLTGVSSKDLLKNGFIDLKISNIAENQSKVSTPLIKRFYRETYFNLEKFFSRNYLGKALGTMWTYPKFYITAGAAGLMYYKTSIGSILTEALEIVTGNGFSKKIDADVVGKLIRQDDNIYENYSIKKLEIENNIKNSKVENSFNEIDSEIKFLENNVYRYKEYKNDFKKLVKIEEKRIYSIYENKIKELSEKIKKLNDDNYKEKLSLNAKKNRLIEQCEKEINFKIAKMSKDYMGANFDIGTFEKMLDNFGEKAGLGGAFKYGTYFLAAGGLTYPISMLDEKTKIFTAFNDMLVSVHGYCMEIEKRNLGLSGEEVDDDFSPYDIDSKIFDNLRDRGDLEWFYRIINKISNPYTTTEVDFPRVLLIEGPSGSGKTTLAKAFSQTLRNIKIKKDLKGHVVFFTVEAKHTYNSGKGDILSMLCDHIKLNSKSTDIMILYFDEFHLFFTNENGLLDHKKIADFLKFFSDLKQYQSNTPGGMFVIASTNKPEYIPHEILDNPDRINNVIRIDYPSYTERIEIIINFLNKNNITTSNFDIEYISSILEGLNLSQGKVIEIMKSAVGKAKIAKKVLDTEIVYNAVNAIARRINKDMRGLHGDTLAKIIAYNASMASVAILLPKESDYIFDMVTIYPSVRRIDPFNMKTMYKRPEEMPLKFGEVYFSKKGYLLDFYSIEDTIYKCLVLLSGKAYCESSGVALGDQAYSDYIEAYRIAYVYYALSKPDEISKIKNIIGGNKPISTLYAKDFNFDLMFNDAEISKKAKNLLDSAKNYLDKNLVKDKDFIFIKDYIAKALEENKMITARDLKINDDFLMKIHSLKKKFIETVNEVKASSLR